MYKEDECGIIRLVRADKLDREIDLLQRDPITMRTYLSLSIECLNKKKDFVIAVVVLDSPQDMIDDFLPSESIRKGMVYLGESINMHRFEVSLSNPTVLSIFKKDVRDPISQGAIKGIYYYNLPYLQLGTFLTPVVSRAIQARDKGPDCTPNLLNEMMGLLPILLTTTYIGRDEDYAKNSVFHQYLQSCKILEDLPCPKEASERAIEQERQIIYLSLLGLIFWSILACCFQMYHQIISMVIIIAHLITGGICLLLVWVNRIL
ncbi:hypothetical protein NEDG_00465 [Nematocida displodere]|uniref:Uncharacterized protein n=1 Tax=Nematocida displodere TaxID=1805483 RepID=A0A177EKU4_9MICR|nr:hypothetical protein NEDG_00465 [Nematocida displodere]